MLIFPATVGTPAAQVICALLAQTRLNLWKQGLRQSLQDSLVFSCDDANVEHTLLERRPQY